MKILKITSLVLLAILCIPFLPMSSASTAQPLVSIETSIVKTMDPVLPSPELPHRLIPLRILLYSQYADDTNELPSTLLAINNTYGTDYYLTELLDYTNLASALPGHDILLIPEQEMSNIAMMQTIGTAWASILPDWVNGGGIVILMDFANATFYGQGIHILNESGLMTISGVTDYYPAGSLTTVYRVDTSDALTRGVAASWSAQSGTISVDTTDGTIIADDGTDPVVVHKIMGQGHIVFLGFDLYATDPNYELLLGNAIRLHRHVVFDSSHFNYGDIFGSYSSYADDLVTAGFAVSNMGTFNPALFDACDVL
ncbi:MAG: hypothetical protein ACFFBU_09450, partial [Promethearchaeota archaeon]